MAAELHLRIVTPARTIVDRKVAKVTFTGVDGGYGILPGHAPFMTAVSQTGMVAITDLDGPEYQFFVSDGFAPMPATVLAVVLEAGAFVQAR